jgi:hypothetical protein
VVLSCPARPLFRRTAIHDRPPSPSATCRPCGTWPTQGGRPGSRRCPAPPAPCGDKRSPRTAASWLPSTTTGSTCGTRPARPGPGCCGPHRRSTECRAQARPSSRPVLKGEIAFSPDGHILACATGHDKGRPGERDQRGEGHPRRHPPRPGCRRRGRVLSRRAPAGRRQLRRHRDPL